jgi:hypothetical protein
MPPRSREYVVRATFHAPIDFVLGWCTDYTPGDPKLEEEDYQRRILARSRRQVVFEDLDNTPDGWMWSHWTVTIHPPDRWHGSCIGNYRGWEVDYRLGPVSGGRTQLTLRGRRTPLGLGTNNPPRAELEKDLTGMWKKFARALDADYRKSLRTRRGRAAERPPRRA